jgi:hypothetical protein
MIQFAENEKIVRIIRRHWLAFIIEIIFILLGAALPYIALVFKKYFFSLSYIKPVVYFFSLPHIFLLSYVLWLELLLIILFVAVSDHYLDVWIITDSRIIDIEQKGTFSRIVSSLRYDGVGDIVVVPQTTGEKIFSYGTVRIKRVGGTDSVGVALEQSDFILSEIRQPLKVKEVILEEQRKNLARLAAAVTSQSTSDQKENLA